MLLFVRFFLVFLVLLGTSGLYAQDVPEDSFLVNNRPGLWGKLAKSIQLSRVSTEPVRMANPYLVHTGKKIRNIEIIPFGFERNLYDTSQIKESAGIRAANALHKNTTNRVIRNNLFFREGDLIQPYLVADNERHLREQIFIQDARIIVRPVVPTSDLVDVIVITKDVFSLGVGMRLSSTTRMRLDLKEENFAGSGSKVQASTYYEKDRRPSWGHGFQFIRRNIAGSFVDWSAGYQTYRRSFSSGRAEETYVYTRLDKPLVSAYMPWIGSAELSFHRTTDAFRKDSIYDADFRYSYLNVDAWMGYNFGSQKLRTRNQGTRLRKLIAVRGLHQDFDRIPFSVPAFVDYRFADITALLTSVSVFRQNFYRTSFIYGFGRNEDVAEGFSASLIGGWTRKQKIERNYYGFDAQYSKFNRSGFYSSYTLRFGSFFRNGRAEDLDVLANIDHFTRLRQINSMWYRRFFMSAGFTHQVNPIFNQPLLLQSVFGLPYFRNGNLGGDMRVTAKMEAVFYHMRKFLGFRMAPFVFSDWCVLRPVGFSFNKSDVLSAIGAGIRTRNENLVFGTIEFRGYYFPRTVAGMKGFRFDVTSNLRFKFNSSFVRKPDFVSPN
jgi:hypothetical protein